MPMSAEMMAAGHMLADQQNCKLYAVVIGCFKDRGAAFCACDENIRSLSVAQGIYMYDAPQLAEFCEDIYAEACADCIARLQPEIVLFGSSVEAKSIASQCAAMFGTGLTADCTALSFAPDGLLVQTRPAFGGSLMADIITPVARPAMVTVRQGIYKAREDLEAAEWQLEVTLRNWHKTSAFRIQWSSVLEKRTGIASADIVVAVGAGVKRQEDMVIFAEFAQRAGAALGGSRVLVERGWLPAEAQIGLSGCNIAPKLLICLGISGSVQFCAGIKNAAFIVAVNTDKQAPICAVAHVCYVGDIYELIASQQ